MKQTYAIVFLILVSLFLGYKFVEYRGRVHDLKDEVSQLNKANKELELQAEKLQKSRIVNTGKVKVVYEIIEKEVGACDNELIGDEFINGLRKISN